MSTGGQFEDWSLLRSNSSAPDGDLERGGGQSPPRKNTSSNDKGCLPSDLLKRLDRGLSGSGRRLSVNLRSERDHHRHPSPVSPTTSNRFASADADSGDDSLGNSAPPEWALLLIGCLLGVATGLCVAAFNRGVSSEVQGF